MEEKFLESFDKTKIYTYEWNDVEKPVGVVQVIHGMAEHAERYGEFARALNNAGYIVFADDHRGHGKTSGVQKLGLYDGNDIFEDTLQDEVFFSKMLKEKYHLPLYVFGHSYGSFLCQAYIEKCDIYEKAILCGSALMKNRPEIFFAKMIAKLTLLNKGKDAPAKLIEKINYGGYLKKVKVGSWLNSDQAKAQEYYKDRFNGKPLSAKFYVDFFSAFGRIYRREYTDKIDRNKPILIISGKCDPVGNMGKSVAELYHFYIGLDVKNVKMKLYDGARHEILNEPIREQVYADIIAFLKDKNGK